MLDRPLDALEPWQDGYWALTDPNGKVLVRLEVAGRRLAIRSQDPKLRDEVAFLNRHLEHPAWKDSSVETFLAAYSRSEENVQAQIQLRPMFR